METYLTHQPLPVVGDLQNFTAELDNVSGLQDGEPKVFTYLPRSIW